MAWIKMLRMPLKDGCLLQQLEEEKERAASNSPDLCGRTAQAGRSQNFMFKAQAIKFFMFIKTSTHLPLRRVQHDAPDDGDTGRDEKV